MFLATDKGRPRRPPDGLTARAWREIYDPGKEKDKGGIWIGWLERYLFLGAFWLDQPVVIGIWLAFKLGTKWEVWKDVTRVPEKLPNVDEVSYLQRRSKWASWLLNRFLIGTVANLLMAMVAVVIAEGIVWAWQHWDFIVDQPGVTSSPLQYRFY